MTLLFLNNWAQISIKAYVVGIHLNCLNICFYKENQKMKCIKVVKYSSHEVLCWSFASETLLDEYFITHFFRNFENNKSNCGNYLKYEMYYSKKYLSQVSESQLSIGSDIENIIEVSV